MNNMTQFEGYFSFDGDYHITSSDGKSHWPTHIRIRLPRRHALQVITMIARQLEEPDATFADVYVAGALRRETASE